MRVTITYDNEVWQPGCSSDWGFSCLVEAAGHTILFDTGANGPMLLENMRRLDIDPASIEAVVISHSHHDHMGGLPQLLAVNPARVYVPASCPAPRGVPDVIKVGGPLAIFEGVFSTGELRNVEQSLLVETDTGLAVIVGCSHPGVGTILERASRFGTPSALIGGLHGFSDLELLRGLDLVCPAHCTQHKSRIEARFPESYVKGGVGRVIEL
jgi:7,8-dihydropterin-6-yl-methyl-4-(beta-D-ribofuranosyl)aminobenzene 5'-phosphate synthase